MALGIMTRYKSTQHGFWHNDNQCKYAQHDGIQDDYNHAPVLGKYVQSLKGMQGSQPNDGRASQARGPLG